MLNKSPQSILLSLHTIKKLYLLLLCSLLFLPTFDQKATGPKKTAFVTLGLAATGYCIYHPKNRNPNMTRSEYEKASKKLAELEAIQGKRTIRKKQKLLIAQKRQLADSWKKINFILNDIENLEHEIMTDKTIPPCHSAIVRFKEYRDSANNKSIINHFIAHQNDKVLCREFRQEAKKLSAQYQQDLLNLDQWVEQTKAFSNQCEAFSKQHRDYETEYKKAKSDASRLNAWKEKYQGVTLAIFDEELVTLEKQFAERHSLENATVTYEIRRLINEPIQLTSTKPKKTINMLLMTPP